MSHRQRDTHVVTIYGEVETGEENSIGDPLTDQQVVLETAAYVFDPTRASAGALEARDTGETATEEKQITLSRRAANDLEEGQQLTMHRRGEPPSADNPVFIINRIVEDTALRGGIGPWRLSVQRESGTTRGDL